MSKVIAKTLVFLALCLASVFAQNGKNPASGDSLEAIVSSLSKIVNDLEEKQSETKSFIDSVSIKAIKEPQEYYTNSFNRLLIAIGIFTIALAFIFCIAQYFISTSNLKIIKKDFNDKVSGIKNDLEKQIEDQWNVFKLIKNDIYRDLSKRHLTSIDSPKFKNGAREDFLKFFNEIGFFITFYKKMKLS